MSDSSIFWISETEVYSSSARPTAPSTPTFMFSIKPVMRSATSCPFSPSGSSRLSSKGWIWFVTPKALSTEKLSASSGTMDNKVV